MSRSSRNNTRNNTHHKYKARIIDLFEEAGKEKDTGSQAHKAKYLAVLISGYLEQAIKELLLHYTSQGTRSQISRYVEETWPKSRNMNADNINTILHQFHVIWSDEFLAWLDEDVDRKKHINSIVSWRNGIAHGQESNTTGVTLVSVRSAFTTITDLVSWIDARVNP